ncbi:MAG: NAD(P)/FAD-dependent oxidoreductase [Chitinophagaceae bacterium]|nr:NAD(P)/FAD-dependent oxidoreductase [Chitinophagaceae bacterium]
MQVHDIAIVGGGLGGLTLAIQAAQQGYSVVLFEKEKYPFHKVCGEYISMESWDFLNRCGINLSAMSLPQINKLSISDTKGVQYNFKLPLGGFGISRFMLDRLLAEKAIAAGVDLRIGEKVVGVRFEEEGMRYKGGGKRGKEERGIHVIETSKSLVTAEVVIGAFGKRSNIDVGLKRPFIQAKANKINNFIGVKYHIRYANETDTIALHNFKDGYCGISSIEEGKSCLCYLTTAANLAANNNRIDLLEQNILSANPSLKKIFIEAKHMYAKPEVISQISFDKKEQVVDHMLMVGDAAGMITPLCGNGMSMAMEAGFLAMQQIDYFLKGQISRTRMELLYTQRWKNHFSFRTAIGRRVQTYFGGASTGIFLRVMKTIPPLAQLLIKQTHGKGF